MHLQLGHLARRQLDRAQHLVLGAIGCDHGDVTDVRGLHLAHEPRDGRPIGTDRWIAAERCPQLARYRSGCGHQRVHALVVVR
jgi:hypothetical protein